MFLPSGAPQARPEHRLVIEPKKLIKNNNFGSSFRMAKSPVKAAIENDVTPRAEGTLLDFDDDTFKGEEKRLEAELSSLKNHMLFQVQWISNN